MKKIIKIIITILIVMLAIGSIGFNLWTGFRYLELGVYNRGFNDALNSIVIQATQSGEVRINTQNGQVILVPK